MSRASFVFACAILVASARAGDDPVVREIEAISRPKEDVTLTFVYPGKVSVLAVKEGDVVRAGTLLVQLDDGPDRIELAQLQAEKDDRLKIEMAQVQLEQKRSLLERIEKASAQQAASPLEVEEGRLEVKLAELTVAREELAQAQAGRKFDEANARIERMALKSPIDGRVEELFVKVGETADRLQKVIRVVSVDRLRIDVAVAVTMASELKCGGTATVRFPGEGTLPEKGQIVFVQAVADAASETLLVRVEVANTTGRPAGEHVRVSFP